MTEPGQSAISSLRFAQDASDCIDDDDAPVSVVPTPASPATLLAAAVLATALGPGPFRRLRTQGNGICICATVPDGAWENPLRDLARRASRPFRVFFRDTGARRGVEAGTVEEMLSWLQKGGALLCASQDQNALPPEFRAVADMVVNLTAPTPSVIASVIKLIRNGRGPRRFPDDLGQGLELQVIAACLRANEVPRRSVERIRRAQDAKRKASIPSDGPRLDDLAGYGPAAEWAARLRTDLSAFRGGTLPWRRLDARAILYGPPGTGKTLFARALARTLCVPCIQTSVGLWFATYAGDLGGIVKAAAASFDQARAAARSVGAAVLFIDEIDSLPDRGALDADRASWWRPVVNYVLSTLDGGGTELAGVIVLAATNAIEAVDPALLRPGRFGTHIPVLPPDLGDLAAILAHHLGGRSSPIPTPDLVNLLRPLVGATPARAAAWARDALDRARAHGREVRLDDVAAVVLPADPRPERERRRAATHEAGHAVVGALLAEGRLVSTSIVPGAHTGGLTVFRSADEFVLTRAEIEDGVTILLAGRAADVVVGDGATAGAGGIGDAAAFSDLSQATSRLTAVHASYGLGATLRHRGHRPETAWYDGDVARCVEDDLRRLMKRAERLVTEHVKAVRAVAEALLAQSYLDASTVERIIAARPPVPPTDTLS